MDFENAGVTGNGRAGFCNRAGVIRDYPIGAGADLHNFGQLRWDERQLPLVQASNGKLYGTTNQATDGSGYGNIFELTTSGTLTSLYSFCLQGPPCTDGYGPVPGLVQAANGDLYGTTEYGGSTDGGLINPFGTVFKVTPGGALTTLYSFPVEDGCAPEPTAGLVQAINGDLYGTTQCGGANGSGTVFKITPGRRTDHDWACSSLRHFTTFAPKATARTGKTAETPRNRH